MFLRGRTALFGGSFNPPHVGHQMACLYLLEALGADGVWLVPAVRHPFGKPLADFAHRRTMCELLAAPFAGRVEVCTVEADAEATGRTFDTVSALQQRHPGRPFALVIGADIMRETAQWYRWAELVELLPVVVLGRAGYSAPEAMPVELPGVASGAIRRRVRDGKAIVGWVPLAVSEYVAAQQLYRG